MTSGSGWRRPRPSPSPALASLARADCRHGVTPMACPASRVRAATASKPPGPAPRPALPWARLRAWRVGRAQGRRRSRSDAQPGTRPTPSWCRPAWRIRSRATSRRRRRREPARPWQHQRPPRQGQVQWWCRQANTCGSCRAPVLARTSSRTLPKAILRSRPGAVRCFSRAVVNGLCAPSPSFAVDPALAAKAMRVFDMAGSTPRGRGRTSAMPASVSWS